MKGRIKNILFVCTGNICRSPFAGALTNKLLQENRLEGICVNTAGLCALPNNAPTVMAVRVASEYALDLSDHKAKIVNKELLAWCDLILVMEKSHKQELLESFPEARGKTLLLRHFARCGSRTRGIADPYGLRYESYRFCFLDIHDAILGLIEYLSSQEKAFGVIRVCCYDGYKANESPKSFEWEGKNYNIARIVDRWYGVNQGGKSDVSDYFKVECKDNSVHIIRYNRLFDSWAIMLR